MCVSDVCVRRLAYTRPFHPSPCARVPQPPTLAVPQDKNADEVLAFIRERYLERAENKKGAVFTHFTEATNTNNIKFVFDSVRSTLLKLNMNEFGIL